MRSPSSAKLTGSQSNRSDHLRSLHGAHLALGSRLAIAGSILFAKDPRAVGARGEDGRTPWGAPVTPRDARKVFEHVGVAPAPPDRVFPLLCPVLEYDWIEAWSCALEYSASGVAELGCAFRTRLQAGEQWICTRYEPGEAIQYAVWLSVGWMVLEVTLRELEDGHTELTWRRTFTATSAAGRKAVGALASDRVEAEMTRLQGKLVRYLERPTG